MFNELIDDLWKLVIVIFLAVIIVLLSDIKDAHSAEADSIQYTSASDLIARVDSVENVVDTVVTGGYWRANSNGMMTWIWADTTIRTRELVDVEVVEPMGKGWTAPGYIDMRPGTAVVFWKWIEN